jgi:hypothetical protein
MWWNQNTLQSKSTCKHQKAALPVGYQWPIVEFAETLGKVVEAPQNAFTNFPQHPLVSIIIILVVIVSFIVFVVIMIIIVRGNSSMNVSETATGALHVLFSWLMS